MTRGSEAEIGEQREAAEKLEFSVIFCQNKRNRVIGCKCVLLASCSPTIHPFHFLVWELETISPVSSVAYGKFLSIVRKTKKKV